MWSRHVRSERHVLALACLKELAKMPNPPMPRRLMLVPAGVLLAAGSLPVFPNIDREKKQTVWSWDKILSVIRQRSAGA
jgi:hypothetical protein